jgi:2-hydroxychromene-2-carboxylate isomerase
MSRTVDFILDFASPNAYFAYKVLPEIVRRHDAKINYRLCLLGGIFKATGNQAPMVAFSNVKGKLDYQMLEIRRFIQRHELQNFRMNQHFPVNSLIMMCAAIAAEREDRLEDYIALAMKAMWEDNKKMEDERVFEAVMTEGGFDGPALLAASKEPDIKEQLMKNTAEAVEQGVFGIPTFFVGGEMYFGKDRLREVEEALTKQPV